jgi:hypothetical protein
MVRARSYTSATKGLRSIADCVPCNAGRAGGPVPAGARIIDPGLAALPRLLDDPQIAHMFCRMVQQELHGHEWSLSRLIDVVQRAALEMAPLLQAGSSLLSV